MAIVSTSNVLSNFSTKHNIPFAQSGFDQVLPDSTADRPLHQTTAYRYSLADLVHVVDGYWRRAADHDRDFIHQWPSRTPR